TEASEALGEAGAEIVIHNKFPNATQVYKGSGSSNLDLIYKNGDEFLIIEAKGGQSPLRTRTLSNGLIVQQGTKAYLDDVLQAMTKKGGEQARIAWEIQIALNNGNVRYFKVQTPINTQGGSPVLKNFKFD